MARASGRVGVQGTRARLLAAGTSAGCCGRPGATPPRQPVQMICAVPRHAAARPCIPCRWGIGRVGASAGYRHTPFSDPPPSPPKPAPATRHPCPGCPVRVLQRAAWGRRDNVPWGAGEPRGGALGAAVQGRRLGTCPLTNPRVHAIRCPAPTPATVACTAWSCQQLGLVPPCLPPCCTSSRPWCARVAGLTPYSRTADGRKVRAWEGTGWASVVCTCWHPLPDQHDSMRFGHGGRRAFEYPWVGLVGRFPRLVIVKRGHAVPLPLCAGAAVQPA